MNKGKDKKRAILKTGLDIASRMGLEGVSIGTLAKAMGMSKSGLFAHFQSKENLQIDILKYAGDQFARKVLAPAVMTEPGISRIRTLVACWIDWASRLSGGCIFVTASIEFSDRPGKVRDNIIVLQKQWEDSLFHVARSAVESGAFKAKTDCRQFAFDLYSLLLGFNYYKRLLNDSQTKKRQEKALDRLLEYYC